MNVKIYLPLLKRGYKASEFGQTFFVLMLFEFEMILTIIDTLLTSLFIYPYEQVILFLTTPYLLRKVGKHTEM